MNFFKKFLFLVLSSILNITMVNGQCNTNTNLCQSSSGPFNFVSPGAQVSSCLDFFGPDYGYVVLYITKSGPLELLIEGDASSGYLDVAIFDVPISEEPCDAILDMSNQISCNYASNSSGCNQIGNYFPCVSSISSPTVQAGDRLMIVVENWSGSSSNFSLELAPLPAAQSGQANPSINIPSLSLNAGSDPYQMSAVDNGGIWSGFGISEDGLFDPSISGQGSFEIIYNIGFGPCEVSDTFMMVVNSILAVELVNFNADCHDGFTRLSWETLSEKNSDYFKIDFSLDGKKYETIGVVTSHGNSSTSNEYFFKYDSNKSGYYRLSEVDLDGLERIHKSQSLTCDTYEFEIYPNPVDKELNVVLEKNNDEMIFYEVVTATGKKICFNKLNGAIDVNDLQGGVYFLKVYVNEKIYIRKFICI